MAYPVNARYEARTPNVTTVKSDWANATDDSFNGLYGGTLTVKSLQADATGGAAATANAGDVTASQALRAGNGLYVNGGGTISTGNFAVSNGSVSASTTVSATTTMTAGTGLTVTTGNATVSSGDVVITSGKLTVSGTVSGDSGPGLVKAKRFYSTGTALVAGDFTLNNWGAGATVSVVGGCDGDFRLKITAGAGPGANPDVTLAFKDGTWTATPIVTIQFLISDDGATTAGNSYVEYDPVVNVSTTTAQWYHKGFTPTNTKVYWYVGRVRGI